MDDSERTEQILATVEAAWAAYESGSPELFDFFTADATVFPRQGAPRLDGREAYRAFVGRLPAAPQQAIQLLHTEVRLLGEAALVTCHERIRTDYKCDDHRVTLLLVPDGKVFKIAHLHLSPLSTPSRTETQGLVEEITSHRSHRGGAGPSGAGRQGAG